MSNEVNQKNNTPVAIPDNAVPGFANKQSLELALKAANILSKASLVPKEYQGNLPNCVIALNMAARMNADPLMVMQNLYIVYGRPGWSSQFLISTFNTSGKFSALRYEWVGEEDKDSWGCKAWAIEKATNEKLVGSTVTIDIAKKEGWYDKKDKHGNEISKWKTMPQQMLMYRAASWFIRVYAPELAMGMHTEEELYDIIDADYEIKVDQEIQRNANTEFIDINELPSEQPTDEAEKADTTQKDAAAPARKGPGF